MANKFIPTKPQPLKFQDLHKSAGILDDYAVRKNVATKEGTIEKVPVNDSDIVNKKYCDNSFLYLDQTTPQTVVNGAPKIENGLLVGTDANFTDFPKAKLIVSESDTGHAYASNLGIVGEASGGNVLKGVGVGGVALLGGTKDVFGTFGRAKIGATAYTGDAIGVKGSSEETHAGGKNIGVYGIATGGATNYSFYGESGTIYNADNIETLASVVEGVPTLLKLDQTTPQLVTGIPNFESGISLNQYGTLLLYSGDGTNTILNSGTLQLAGYTTDGFVRFTNGDGTLGVGSLDPLTLDAFGRIVKINGDGIYCGTLQISDTAATPASLSFDGGSWNHDYGWRPTQDNVYNLGDPNYRYANGYFGAIYGDASNLTNIPAPSGVLLLDQTTPQMIINGQPIFEGGIAIDDGTQYIYSSGGTDMDFYVGNGIKATITETGNVLVGTTTDAGYKFQSYGTTFRFGEAADMFRMETGGSVIVGSISDSGHNFQVAGTTSLDSTTITTDGAGNITATSFITNGGTSADVVMGDGTLTLSGISSTITTAKLTAGGADGSMTFTNGILTAQTPAT